jgi:hypothetical protein
MSQDYERLPQTNRQDGIRRYYVHPEPDVNPRAILYPFNQRARPGMFRNRAPDEIPPMIGPGARNWAEEFRRGRREREPRPFLFGDEPRTTFQDLFANMQPVTRRPAMRRLEIIANLPDDWDPGRRPRTQLAPQRRYTNWHATPNHQDVDLLGISR